MKKQYLQIIKPKIIFSNLISITGGFFLASKGKINYLLFFTVLIAMLFVIASSCIFNNIIDRDIDFKMKRTCNRVLATGLISVKLSLIYGIILIIAGCILLYYKVNTLTMILASIGFVIYVVIYSLYMKRNSMYGISIGSISGAIPPIIGYCAVSDRLDICALILLFIFSLWQIPHSYAIAILHLDDYQDAKIPVLPAVKGIKLTKFYIILYILIFIISSSMLTLNGYTGYKYLIVTSIVNICWLSLALSGYKSSNNKVWAYKVFIFSIFAIASLSIMMSIDFIIPTANGSTITFN
ncbi:heme o synthase [Pantoea sp. Mhis]|uniref:heme o synthase n=1 Tax=Pantoea sp. Mhis TaxID=2576759 RepID=UPI0013593125|nr:heme o synthase [Pantoea sp. Mhis]MXP56241.1 protoheme IX farnesyltransferase [Pantoea sp. Mhis]